MVCSIKKHLTKTMVSKLFLRQPGTAISPTKIIRADQARQVGNDTHLSCAIWARTDEVVDEQRLQCLCVCVVCVIFGCCLAANADEVPMK